MCGRYSLTSPVEAMRHLFGLSVSANLAPRYNIAPSQEVVIARLDAEGGLEWALARWGLVPSWAKDPAIGDRMINARSETMAEKPSFRAAFRRRHCLIPADGFYEWRRMKGAKQPYRIHLEGNRPFAFAGLWERWEGAGQVIESCAILTTDAAPAIRPIHHRMPVILPPEAHAAWLDVSQPFRLADLNPLGDEALRAHAVSAIVNHPANDDRRCLEPLSEEPPRAGAPKDAQGSLF